MAKFSRQGIAIDDENNTATENVPRQGETTSGTGNRRREGIISPQKSGNLQNYLASFRHYLQDAVLSMALLKLFLIMFPEEYIGKVFIPEIKNRLSVPMDFQSFKKWVGFCLYISCWVGIESCWDWRSTMTPLMAKGALF